MTISALHPEFPATIPPNSLRQCRRIPCDDAGAMVQIVFRMLVTCEETCTLAAKMAENAVNVQIVLHVDSTGRVNRDI